GKHQMDVAVDARGSKLRHSLELAFRGAPVDQDIRSFDISEPAQPLAKCGAFPLPLRGSKHAKPRLAFHLRLSHCPAHSECDDDCKKPHPCLISDYRIENTELESRLFRAFVLFP